MEIEAICSKEKANDHKDKEWPGIKEIKDRQTVVKPQLLIMELGRLVPSFEGEYVRFSPINMPTIRIGCTHIIGLILKVSRNSKQYKFIVDDGTGLLNVICKLDRLCTMQKENQGKAQTSKDDPNDKALAIGRYVRLEGFLSLSDYNRSYKDHQDKNPLKRLSYGQPVFYSVNIEFLSENEYYRKMCLWIKAAKKRYSNNI